jgi:hypothetical protein
MCSLNSSNEEGSGVINLITLFLMSDMKVRPHQLYKPDCYLLLFGLIFSGYSLKNGINVIIAVRLLDPTC